MTFKASLQTPFVIANPKLPSDTTLHFTKSQIIFPKTLTNGHYQNANIKNGTHYKLVPHDEIFPQLRYEIKISNGDIFRLVINKHNERKLKWIHKLYSFQKDATAAIVISIISLLTTIVLGVLQLICK